MGSVSEYFKSLGSGVVSLVKGLQVTGSELVKGKITEYYPEDRNTYKWPERFRAILTLVYDKEGNHKCIACGTCERVCPNGTIKLDIKTVETWDGKKKKKLDKYFYDLGTCTFCDLCVTNCPTSALAFSNDFEQAVFTREKLMKKLNYLPEKPEHVPTPEEIAKLQAEKEAKIAAAKVAAAAKAAAAKAAPAAAAAAPAAAAPAAPAINDKLAAAIEKAKKAVEDAATPEEKAAAQAKLDKIEAALKAKAAAAPAAAAPAAAAPAAAAPAAAAPAAPVINEKLAAAIEKAKKAVEDAATPEEKAAAQAKLDKIEAALKAKGAM